MNRQARTLVVVAVAVGVAGIASFAVYRAIQAVPERRVEIATRHAVVATAALPVGTKLSRESVKLVAWPEQNPIEGAFTSVDEVIDRGLVASVVANEPIIETKLAPKEAGAGLPPTITPGMRAISVRVNEVIGVAGFVVPGTRVDVVTVIDSGADGKAEKVSRVVVSNAQVLSSGTRYDQEEAKSGQAVRSTVVTLMVTPPDAERIALAQAEGQLMLTLRHPLDVQPSDTTGIRRAALFGDAPPPPPVVRAPRRVAPPVAAAVVPQDYKVETIRAAKRTQEVVH